MNILTLKSMLLTSAAILVGQLSPMTIAQATPNQWTSLPGQACTTENHNQDKYLTTVESAVRTSATTWVVCPLTNLKANYGGTSNKMKFFVDMYLAGSSHSVPCWLSNNGYYTNLGSWQYMGAINSSGYRELYKSNVTPHTWGSLSVSCRLRAGDRMESISYYK